MKTKLMVLAILLPASAFAQTLTCKVKNVISVPIGNATIESNQITMNLGFNSIHLDVISNEDNSIVAQNQAKTWNYIFSFDQAKPNQALTQGGGPYKTTIYHQRVSEPAAEPLFFAKAVCN